MKVIGVDLRQFGTKQKHDPHQVEIEQQNGEATYHAERPTLTREVREVGAGQVRGDKSGDRGERPAAPCRPPRDLDRGQSLENQPDTDYQHHERQCGDTEKQQGAPPPDGDQPRDHESKGGDPEKRHNHADRDGEGGQQSHNTAAQPSQDPREMFGWNTEEPVENRLHLEEDPRSRERCESQSHPERSPGLSHDDLDQSLQLIGDRVTHEFSGLFQQSGDPLRIVQQKTGNGYDEESKRDEREYRVIGQRCSKAAGAVRTELLRSRLEQRPDPGRRIFVGRHPDDRNWGSRRNRLVAMSEPFPFQPPVETMEAKTVEVWPTGQLAYEPKWDGFRAVAWSRPDIRLDSRNQRPLLRYFPELEPAIEALPEGTVVDGEVVVVIDGVTSFDHLSQRIHPAESRISKLSRETPAQLVAFDLLALGRDLRPRPFSERRELLVDVITALPPPWNLTPSTPDQDLARRWFEEFEPAGCDGIVAKPLDGPYMAGKRAMFKIKHRRTVDCVVGGFREHKDGGMVGSLLLGLYDEDGRLAFVGHCSGFRDHDRAAILTELEKLRTDQSFDSDVRTPGAESRWTAGKDLSWVPIKPGVVVEVSYDQLENERFRHATRFHRWRPEKDPKSCTFEQLERPSGASFQEVIGKKP